jgi:hypothetical protein
MHMGENVSATKRTTACSEFSRFDEVGRAFQPDEAESDVQARPARKPDLDKKRPVRVRRQANPHRPGISPALGPRTGPDDLCIPSRTA